MKNIKHLLFLFLLGMIFTTTVHSQEKDDVEEIMEPIIVVEEEVSPARVK